MSNRQYSHQQVAPLLLSLVRYARRTLAHLVRGRLGLALSELLRPLPSRLVVFNMAVLLRAESVTLPAADRSSIRVWVATPDDLDDVLSIHGLTVEHATSMMQSGAMCYLAARPGQKPEAYAWSAFGHCYIRGIGLEYDFGGRCEYSYFNFTQPQARRKGLYLEIKRRSVEHALELGIDRFAALVECANSYSLSLHEKMGYKPFLKVRYLKILALRICRYQNLDSDEKKLRIFFREPEGDLTII